MPGQRLPADREHSATLAVTPEMLVASTEYRVPSKIEIPSPLAFARRPELTKFSVAIKSSGVGMVLLDTRYPVLGTVSRVHIHSEHITSTGSIFNPWRWRIFCDRGWRIKAHRLVVEQGGGKGGEIVAFQISAGIGNQREAGGRAIREIRRARKDVIERIISSCAFGEIPFCVIPARSFGFDVPHAGLRPFEAHGAAQIFRLTAA